MTAQSGAIRAGAAYVEVLAEPNLDPGLNNAKNKLQNWSAGMGTQAAGQLKEGFARVASAVNLVTPQLAGVGKEISAVGAGMGILQNALSGPIGWASLAAGAATAAVSLATVNRELTMVGETTKQLLARLKGEDWPRLFGRTAQIGPDGRMTFEKDAATAASQHADAKKKAADAAGDLETAAKSAAARQREYNELVAKQAQLDKEAEEERLRAMGTRGAPGPRPAQDAADANAEATTLAAVRMAEAVQAHVKAQQDMAKAASDWKRSEEEAARLTRQEREDREAIAEIMDATTAGAVKAAATQPPLAGQPYSKDIFDPTEDAWKQADKRRDQEFQHKKSISDFTVQQNAAAARLEIELSGKTAAEKKAALLDLKHEEEVADLWGRGLGDTDAEDALLSRQALEKKLAGAELLKPQGATVAGTFSAWTAAGLGGASDAAGVMRDMNKGIDRVATNTAKLIHVLQTLGPVAYTA